MVYRDEVVIGLALDENGVVGKAQAARQKIRDVFREMNAETARVGVLDPSTIERFAGQLRTAIKEAFSLDLSNSHVMKHLNRASNGQFIGGGNATKEGVLGTTREGSSKFAAEQLRLFLADLNKAAVDVRSKLKVGDKAAGGYATEEARTRAQAQASLRVELATRQLERAIQRDADAIAKGADAEAKEAQRRRDQINKAHTRRWKAEEAAARKAEEDAAKQKQDHLDEINKAHTKRWKAEEKAARAAEAEAAKVVERAIEAARQDQLARGVRVSYANPNLAVPLGRAQSGVNDAERALETATMARTRILADENRTAEQMVAIEGRVSKAKTAHAVAVEKVNIEMAREQAALAGDQKIRNFQTSYPNAVAGTPTGDRQRTVNRAERRLEEATFALAKMRNDPKRDEGKLHAAEGRLDAATDNLAKARVKLREHVDRQLAGQQADRDAAAFRVSFPNARPNTPIGLAQVGINNAERALAVTTGNLATLRTTAGRTTEQIIAAERRVEGANIALAGAQYRLAQVQSRSADLSLLQQFRQGFKGQSEMPYAQQLGQAMKFSLFYGTAYKLQFAFVQTLQQTLQEGIAFQQAVTQLKLATQDTSERMDDLAATLGSDAVAYGAAPSQGVLTGARAIGLYGQSDGSYEDQRRVALISERVVSRLALTSGMKPEDIQTNIAAISQAFGGGAEGAYRTADLDQYFSEKFGAAPGATIQAVAESGSVGAAAGFNQDEVNAIAALMMGRTGNTASAVAGYMAQIFSRGGEGSLQNVAQRYGVDTNLTLAQQVKELSAIYRKADSNDKTTIAASFGRGKVGNAVIALLEGMPEIEEYSGRARTDADGAADKAAQMKLGDIGGQIQLTVSTMQAFAETLGHSGMLEVLGAGVVVFRDLTEAATGVLKVWNEIPGPVRAAVAAVTALAVASRNAAVMQAIGISRVMGPSPLGALPAGTRMVTPAAGGAAVPLASRAGAAALAGNALAGGAALLTNPITLAVGGLLAIGALKNTSDGLRDAQKFATTVLNSGTLSPDSTPDDYRNQAAALTDAAKSQREAASGWWDRPASTLMGKYDPAMESAQRLEDMASFNTMLAAAKERWAAEAAATSAPNSSLITGFDETSLGDSMNLIAAAGGTAEEQFKALGDALRGTADAAENAANAFNPDRFGMESANPILDALIGSLDGVVVDPTSGKDITSDWIRDNIDPATIARSVSTRFGDTDLASASDEQLAAIANGVIEDLPVNNGLIPKEKLAQARKDLLEYLKGQREPLKDLIDGAKDLTGPEVMAVIDYFTKLTTERLGNLQETDYAGRAAAARQLVRRINDAIASGERAATPGALLALANARRQVAEIEIDRLEALRRAAQQNASNDRQVAARGRRFLTREINAAVAGGAQDKLVEIVGLAGKYGKGIALKAIDDALAIARAASEVQHAADGVFDLIGGFFGNGESEEARKPSPQVKMLEDFRDAIVGSVHGDRETDPFLNGDKDGSSTEKDKETLAEREAARAAANAVRSGSSVAAARAEIQSARAAIAKADKNSVAYWNAMGQLYSAQQGLADAILERTRNQMLLGIDMTNPLAMARVDLNIARRKLAQDRNKGKSQEVIDADKIAVRNAEASREATAFQQRLDSVTTAEQLGRISHQKYLKYLNSEHNRLESIKHRTFQQQQQLDQIDGLMKEAASAMDAQWNFGDIKLPTPYQVRRYIEQQSPDLARNATTPSGAGNRATSTTTIYIDGADTGKVKKIIEEVTGKSARTTTSKPRRR